MVSILLQTPMTLAYILTKNTSRGEEVCVRLTFLCICSDGTLVASGYLSAAHQNVFVFCTVTTGWRCCLIQENTASFRAAIQCIRYPLKVSHWLFMTAVLTHINNLNMSNSISIGTGLPALSACLLSWFHLLCSPSLLDEALFHSLLFEEETEAQRGDRMAQSEGHMAFSG